MKQVWKCDFCTTSDTDRYLIEQHEKDCSFNPINKRCFSCINYEVYFGDYSGEECTAGQNYSMIQYENLKCDKWAEN
jgi:hypothetical protein